MHILGALVLARGVLEAQREKVRQATLDDINPALAVRNIP